MSTIDLYHPLILERNKNPKFYQKPIEGEVVEAYNPVCGDEFKLVIQLDGGIISDATYTGYGCAVSKAAIDMLMEQIVGRSIEAAVSTVNDYLGVLKMDHPPGVKSYPLAVFQRVKHHPAREDCATLGATSLKKFLQKKAK